MNPKIEFESIAVKPITRTWSPSLAFKYRTTAEHKRRLHTFHKYKNYRERVGLPIRFYADPLASDEIKFLRSELAQVRNPWLCLADIKSLTDEIAVRIEALP